ncbi:hypothetical protein Tco_1443539, partial [Tanacetum coccineum]
WQSRAPRNHRGAPAQTRSERVLKQPNEPPLPEGHTPGSDEGRLKLEELMAMCTKLSKQVLDLEKEKDAQAMEILKLKKRVNKLEIQRKSSISHPRRRIYRQVESSDDDLDEEDASKQERISDKTKPMFKDCDFDDLDDLVDEGMAFVQEKDAENQGKIGADDTEVLKGSGDTKAVNTAGEGVSTAAPRTPPTTTTVFDDEDVTMDMAQTLIKMKEEKAKKKGVSIKDVEDSSRPIRSITTLQHLPTIDPKDKDEELRVERERQEEDSKVAIAEMFDEVQARIDADYELAARTTQEEQEKYTNEERASQLKGKSYEEIQGLYERQQKRIQDFTPMDSEKEAQKPGKRLKRVAGSYATQNSPKKPKLMKFAKDVTEEEAAEYEKEKEELRADGSSSYHGDTQAFLRRLDRKDLNDLYRMIFDPDEKDELWMNQLDWKLLRWKLYESCGVHTLFMDGKPMEINMLVEKKYPLVKELLERMLNLQLEAEEESTMAFELIKFIKSLLQE